MEKPANFIERTKTVQYGAHVLLRLPSNGVKIVQTKEKGVVNLGKFGTFEIEGIIGFPYGQTFEVLDDKKVRPVSSSIFGSSEEAEEEQDQEQTPEVEDEITTKTLDEKIDFLKKLESSENNKDLIDIGNATQSLSMEEIETLKKTSSGSNVGESIIDKLIKNHVNFQKKTKHSQEKYLKRKQQKFLRKFTIEYLDSSNLLKYYLDKDASKVLDMSEETLGLMLSLANVQAGGRYLVIDETGGVLTYAMMERMRGLGQILVLHENEHPNLSALVYSNLTIEQQRSMFKTINLLQFFDPENERVQWNDFSEEELKNMKSNKRQHYYRRKNNAIDINNAIDESLKGNFDGLLIASTLYTPTLLTKLVDKIGGSRPIVIYNQFKELLIETQLNCMNDLRFLAPTLHETRVRPYQTIPGRIHPLMAMRGFGSGYLLSALKVIPIENGVTAVGRGLKKQKIEAK